MSTINYGNADHWHNVQAAMLHYFTSVEYIEQLHFLVTQLINGTVDPLLELAETQGRDSVLISRVWGKRNTSENWGNNAWPILKDLQAALAKDVVLRKNGRFEQTATNECLRGIEQYSMDWTSPSEERAFDEAIRIISQEAGKLDDTLSASDDNRWTDYDFAYWLPSFAAQRRKIQKFRVRTDIVCETGELAPITGIYISKDDPNATVQFVWVGANGPSLRCANTFNEVGLSALNFAGRDDLWFDFTKMFDFATLKQNISFMRPYLFIDDEPAPELAPSAVARFAFAQKNQRWCLLEPIAGEFDEITAAPISKADAHIKHRIPGGGKCQVAGFYFAPSIAHSRRRFESGDITPNFDSKYGQTIWQWDAHQD
jgi:hypothetical protein